MNIYPIYRDNIQGDKFTRLLLRIEIGDYIEKVNDTNNDYKKKTKLSNMNLSIKSRHKKFK